MKRLWVIGCVLGMFVAPAMLFAQPDFIWWEGEDARETNFPSQTFFSPANAAEADKLSGGKWLSNEGVYEETPFATYEVNVPSAGTYNFWVRKFWFHGPFRWRFGDAAWRTCDQGTSLADGIELRKHLVANWVSLGQVEVPAGKQTLRIELLRDEGAACFDCFVLTPGSFSPRGKLKPSDKYNRAPEGWFAFEPDTDSFSEALLDLRPLNHKVAGEKGFLVSKDGDFSFQNDSTPLRFWAVNAHPTGDKQSDVYLAKRLAKLGVNMVRIHGAVYDSSADDPGAIDLARLDKIHHFVSALKNEGIYTKLSFYFPLWFEVRPGYGLPGYEGTQNKYPFALLFFHPRMQEIYKSWAKGLLRTPNPYTGLPLADDPAVGIVEIINEDNYLFWTTTPYENVPAPGIHLLEERFARWLEKKYGSLNAAMTAWGNAEVKGDDLANGRVGLYGAWSYTSGAKGSRSEPRIRDQLQFVTEDLRQFYEDMHGWFREAMGVKCPMTATNWRTADYRLLGALDKYTNAACETMDRHEYFGGMHKGEDSGYTLRSGHQYQDRSVLKTPASSTVCEIEYTGHTHIVTEYNYPMPNRYRAESMLLAPAYGALQGTDAYFNFAINSANWQAMHGKFSLYTPGLMGQFPGAALIFRQGFLKRGPVVVHETVGLKDLYDLKGTAIAQPQNLDELRKADIPAGASGEVEQLGSVDPLAYFVGRVTRTVADDPGESIVQDLSPFIDRERKTIKSSTGELLWDYGKGLMQVTAPCAQAVTGFLAGAGKIDLGDVSVESGNEYGTVMVVSLDGQPIASSSRILVQVMTEDANYGWKTSGDQTKTITDLGAPPIVVKELSGTISINRADAASLKVLALDGHGYRRKELPAGASGELKIDLLPDCLYYVIQN
jgi:hypothetical protein